MPQKKKSHCGRGHSLSGENLYFEPTGKRHCRECARVRAHQEKSIEHRKSWHAANLERKAYYDAKRRCTDPKNPAWKDYGGRGIEFRFENFGQFLFWVEGYKPTPQHSLDRIENNGHYEPGNVRWATPLEQRRNRR